MPALLKTISFLCNVSLALLVLAGGELHSNELELVAKTTVEEKALTFAVGPAAKFSSTVNGRTHQQTPLITYRGYQYVTFYDADRRVCIGRRKLPGLSWDVIHFDDHKFETNDSHNTTVIGICDKDGTIHMAFDHHASQLNYRVSKLGAAHDPDSTTWNAQLFGKVTHSLGSVPAAERVTYPRFFNASNGNLMLYYRARTSGDGDGMIEEYDGDKHDWTPGLGKFIARDIGTYQANGRTSLKRCPYMNALSYAGNRLHASWVWRDLFKRTNPDNQHDLCYAYSDDHGRTWCNSDGKVVGKTGHQPIHLDTPGLVVAPIPTQQWLSNSNTHYGYADGSFHVMLRHRVPGEMLGQYVHYWRDYAGKWSQQVLPLTGGRPKLVGTPDRTLLLVSEDEEQIFVAKGEPSRDGSTWNWSKLKLPKFQSCYGEAVVDFQRWELEGVLSVYSQAEPKVTYLTELPGAVDGFPSPLNVVDYKLAAPASGSN